MPDAIYTIHQSATGWKTYNVVQQTGKVDIKLLRMGGFAASLKPIQ
jgi:hypothetical protein